MTDQPTADNPRVVIIHEEMNTALASAAPTATDSASLEKLLAIGRNVDLRALNQRLWAEQAAQNRHAWANITRPVEESQ